jgi:hypothetical protein
LERTPAGTGHSVLPPLALRNESDQQCGLILTGHSLTLKSHSEACGADQFVGNSPVGSFGTEPPAVKPNPNGAHLCTSSRVRLWRWWVPLVPHHAVTMVGKIPPCHAQLLSKLSLAPLPRLANPTQTWAQMRLLRGGLCLPSRGRFRSHRLGRCPPRASQGLPTARLRALGAPFPLKPIETTPTA